jgi:hypothetical protein
MRTDRYVVDMTKQTVAFRCFADTPSKWNIAYLVGLFSRHTEVHGHDVL